jgi:hypothetical protein
MSTTITQRIGGNVYHLNDGDPYLVTGWQGLGMIPLERKSQRGPLQDGDTDLGWRGLPRFFGLSITIDGGCTVPQLIGYRRTLLTRLAPRDNPFSLRFDVDGTLYQIDAVVISEPGDLGSDEVYGLKTVPVRFKASDPTFYDPAAVAVSFSLGGGTDALEIPLEIPMVVGASTLDATASVTYAGDVDAYPTLIRITGPITDAVITNTTTGDKLDFTGTTIAAGDFYDIDCRYGNKTVVDSLGASQIADLTDDSDLATFRLVPSDTGQATRINTFSVTGSSVTAATNVELTFNTRFSGI